MATYAIGDIQGCYDELKILLDIIKFQSEQDKLLICGDIINRGPKSLETLEFLYSIKKNCHITLGNHDLHFLAVAEGVKEISDSDTFQALLEDKNLDIPKPKQITIDLPNNHLKYAITWYAISISIIFYYLYFRRKK